jgi:general secretion pathway protein D
MTPFQRRFPVFLALLLAVARPMNAQDSVAASGRDSVSVRFVDADLRAVIQALGAYLTKPVLTNGIPATRVTLETPTPVPRSEVLPLLTGLAEGQGLQVTEEASFFRVAPKPPGPAPSSPAAPSGSFGAGTGPVQLYVVRLKHARAADVAATVNLLFGGSGAFAGSSGLSGGTLSEELRRQQVPPAGSVPATAPGPPAAGGAASFQGQVTIIPDELTNSLLIRASHEDFEVLTQAIDQLDIRPLQVLIEVLIVEARHDLTRSFGTGIMVPPQPFAGGTIDATTPGAGLTDLIIHLMDIGHAHIDAVLSAAQAKGDVEIISRPVLIASNNTEAHFLVGTQQPFVQVSRALPTDNNNTEQVVQYRDVGTKLTVRPTINQDGYVSLLIQQEVNNATGEVLFSAPVISTREASTQVLVRDQQTIVIGGLRDQQMVKSSAGVPFLSSLPLLGGLFGTTKREKHGTELFIFLTPRILKTDADVDSVTVPRVPTGSLQ